MQCSLCLKEISDSEASTVFEEHTRHQSCHDELEKMIEELAEIYEEVEEDDDI